MTEEKSFAGVNPLLMRSLRHEERERAGWKVFINGEDKTGEVLSLCLRHEKMELELRYGMRAEGFDGFLFHEPGGGGSVLTPFIIHNGELFIGLVEEERKNMGGRVLDAPGGFLDPGETHFKTATREFEEETGVTAKANKVLDLGEYAEPANANRAIVDTSEEGEGAHFYALEFTKEQLELARDPKLNTKIFLFKEGTIKPVKGDKGAEKIFGCTFYPWHVAASRSDMFANAAFSRLFVYLCRKGRVKPQFS